MTFLSDKAQVPEFVGPRIAIYSCYFGKHEPLNKASMGKWVNVDKFVFTDDPDLTFPGAKVIVVPDEGLDPKLGSRKPKLNPHLHLSDYDWVIYIDNRASLKVHPVEIIATIRDWEKDESWAGRYLFRHAHRDCAYDEAIACVGTGVIDPEKQQEIAAFLQSESFPRNFGLYVNTIMIQRMGDKTTDAFNEMWFDLLSTLCHRDQVSMGYALWTSGYAPRVLPFSYGRFIDWPIFSNAEREDFRALHR